MTYSRSGARTILAVIFTLLVGPCTVRLFAQDGVWTTKAPMPTPRFGLSTCVVNGIIYAIGGGHTGLFQTVEAYDPATNTWTTKAPMPTARYDFSTSAVNGIIYAVGGFNNGFLGTVEAYNPATNTWTTKAPMLTPRADLSTSVVNGVIYAVGGGRTYGDYSETVEAYDPTSNTWTTKAPMPTPRDELGTSVVDGILYAVGGVTFGYGALGTVEAYDPASDTWTTKAPMPTARYYFGTSAVNDFIYIMGGVTEYNSGDSVVEAYNATSDTWTTVTSMPTNRQGLSASVVNGVIYAIGGYSNQGFFGVDEAFTSAFADQGPTARVLEEQTVECSGDNCGTVTLNGWASSDPDGDTLTYSWTGPGNVVVGTTPSTTVAAPLGTTAYTLTVTNPDGLTSSATTHVTVQDSTPPALSLPISITINATGLAGAAATYAATATDTCDPNPKVMCSPASGSIFPAGTTTVNCSAKDASGNIGTGSFAVIVNGAAAQIANLILVVNGLDISHGTRSSLDAKLQSALAALAAVKAHDTVTVCNKMNLFIGYLRTQSGKQITVSQASQLIALGGQIKETLGCP